MSYIFPKELKRVPLDDPNRQHMYQREFIDDIVEIIGNRLFNKE
jgi:hypothetical protein